MDVVLERVARTVVVRGVDHKPLGQPVSGRLEDLLTYFEKTYDITAAAGGHSGFSLVSRKLYATDTRTGLLYFPLGLRPRVAQALTAAGHRVSYVGGTLLEIDPKAHTADWDGLLADFQLYPGQGTCLTRIASSDGGIISATTGFGKSVIMRMLCRLYCRAKIHVVTKSQTLAHEIFNDLSPIIPNLGFVGGGKRRFSRVTVIMADSLHHGMGDADILFADECHQLAAPKYAEKLGMYSRTRMFGMSATPTGRADNRDLVAEALFGPILYTISYQDAQAQGRVVPITVEWLRMKSGPALGGIKMPVYREKIGVWQNEDRNAAIAARVRQFGPDEQVLIMVKTIEHAVRLKNLLPEFSLAYAKDGMDEARISDYVKQGLLPADEPVMTGDRVGQLRTAFAAGTLKKVIANSVWSTGVNFRTLAVLVRADAAASEILDGQIPGRVCRRVPGVKEAAIMIDCWDEWDASLLGRSRKRKANYAKRGWVQVFQPPPVSSPVPGVTP